MKLLSIIGNETAAIVVSIIMLFVLSFVFRNAGTRQTKTTRK